MHGSNIGGEEKEGEKEETRHAGWRSETGISPKTMVRKEVLSEYSEVLEEYLYKGENIPSEEAIRKEMCLDTGLCKQLWNEQQSKEKSDDADTPPTHPIPDMQLGDQEPAHEDDWINGNPYLKMEL